MKTIASFEVDHTKLVPGIYISRIDGDITTYDLRFVVPNGGAYLPVAAMHTIEHLFAVYARNSAYGAHIIYFGPMGCRTGFYLLVRDADHTKVLDLIRELFGARFSGGEAGMRGICAKDCFLDPAGSGIRKSVEECGWIILQKSEICSIIK